MAKVVNDYVFTNTRKKYPDEWLNGETWTFAKGEDYENPKSFVHVLRQKAKNAGKGSNASIKDGGATVYFRAVAKAEGTQAPAKPSKATNRKKTTKKAT